MLKLILIPLAYLYQLITSIRNFLYNKHIFKSKKLDIPVISIGNITAGGTGKTPFTISLANRLVESGFSPAIITRGYKRKSKDQVIVSEGNGAIVSPLESGDEAFLMSQKTKNVVIIADKNRFAAGKTAQVKYHCDIVIADDAFQHRKLHRNFNIVLWDSYASPLSEKMLPIGRLRESFSGMKRADLVIFTRTHTPDENAVTFFAVYGLKSDIAPTKIETLYQQNTAVEIKKVKRQRILAFCGLGNHEQFFDTVKQLEPAKLIIAKFPDHHKYSSAQMEKLFQKATLENCDYLITTEKDLTNIPEEYCISDKLLVLGISLEIRDELYETIINAIKDLK